MKKLLSFLLIIPLLSFGQTSEEYFNDGVDKERNRDYRGV